MADNIEFKHNEYHRYQKRTAKWKMQIHVPLNNNKKSTAKTRV